MMAIGKRYDFNPAVYTADAALLDLPIPGVEAAYSTRKLRKRYTGPALQVRRSSDDAVMDIGFTPEGALDEGALLSFVGLSSGFVATAYDQSGKGRNLTQATKAAQPRVVNAGAVERMGNAAAPVASAVHYGTIVDSCFMERDEGIAAAQLNTEWHNEWIVPGAWLGRHASHRFARGDNLLDHPQRIDLWPSKSNVTITDSDQPGPDGTPAKLVAFAAGGYAIASGTSAAGELVFLTQILKAGTPNANPRVYMTDNVVGEVTATFDLVAGTAGAPATAASWSEARTTIEPLANGWYACSIIARHNSGGSVSGGLSAGSGAVHHFAGKLARVADTPASYINSPELVPAGSNDGLTNWVVTTAGASTATMENGAIKLTGDGVNQVRITLTIPTAPGKTYRVSHDGNVGGSTVSRYVGTSVATYNNVFTPPGTTAFADSFVFTAGAGATSCITFVRGGLGTIFVDNVSIKEVTAFVTPYVPYAALAGKYFQATSDGNFYMLNDAYTATEVFRGNKRAFPRLALLVLTTTRLIIYDADTGEMWMVFAASVGLGWENCHILRNNPLSSVAAAGGEIFVGTNSADGGVTRICFAEDTAYKHIAATGYGGKYKGSIAARNTTTYGYNNAVGHAYPTVINNNVYDVAAAVLPGAPLNPKTNMPVPTVYAFTGGGVTRIAHNGTWSSTTSLSAVVAGWIDAGSVRALCQGSGVVVTSLPATQILPAGSAGDHLNAAWTAEAYHDTSIPAVLRPSGKGAKDACGGALGMSKIMRHPTTPAKSAVANITNAYNTGYMVGDIRACWLSDVVAGAVPAATILSDSFAYADTTALLAAGWTAQNGATVELVAGRIRVTTPGGQFAMASKQMTCVIGQPYAVILDAVFSSVACQVGIGTAAVNINLGYATRSSSGQLVFYFTATATTHHISLYMHSSATAGQYVEFDSVDVKLADADRSVKGMSLIPVGSITKAPVAAGAQLMGYTFASGGYFEQPPTTNLDVGTGDFGIAVWFKATFNNDHTILYRNSNKSASSPVNGINIWGYSANGLAAFKVAMGGAVSLNTPANYAITGWHMLVVRRVAGVLYVDVNGVNVASAANAANLTLADAVASVGSGFYTGFGHSLAELRVSATAPSIEQVAEMYLREKEMFEVDAQVTLPGTSPAIKALDHSVWTDALHGATGSHLFTFRGLVRTSSKATPFGEPRCISTHKGHTYVGGTTLGGEYTPATNKQPAFRTDGTDDCLQTTSFGPVSLPYSRASVLEFVRPATTTGYLFDGVSSVSRSIMSINVNGSVISNAGTGGNIVANNLATGAVGAVIERFDGANSFATFNGVLGNTADGGDDECTGITVGGRYNASAGNFAAAKYGDIVLYSGPLSTTQHKAVDSHLRASWSTP